VVIGAIVAGGIAYLVYLQDQGGGF
jgi:hypothetical protein